MVDVKICGLDVERVCVEVVGAVIGTFLGAVELCIVGRD